MNPRINEIKKECQEISSKTKGFVTTWEIVCFKRRIRELQTELEQIKQELKAPKLRLVK